VVVGTTLPSAGGRSVTPSATAAPQPTIPGKPLILTMADSGKTITLKVGQRFVLQLRDTYEWTVAVQEPAVIGQVPSPTPAPGIQGVYEALSKGATTVHADGLPFCAKVQPRCMMATLAFELRVIVQ
jgi:hypothetical protein